MLFIEAKNRVTVNVYPFLYYFIVDQLMKQRNFFTVNKNRAKTEKEEQLHLRYQQDSSKGFGAKKFLNSLQTSLMMFSPKYYYKDIERDQFIEPWNNNKINNYKKCQEKIFFTKQQTQRKETIVRQKLLKSIKSQVLKNKTKLPENLQINPNFKRQKLKTQQLQKNPLKKIKIETKQSRNPKSFFLKKIDLLVKIKQKSKVSQKKFKSSSIQKVIKRQKLPKLQKITIDPQFLNKKIVISSHSSLYNELSELNKLISSESVTIKPKMIC